MATIVVIDDEISVTTLVKDMLEEEGYTVLATTNAEHGVNLVRQRLPDLVICDRLMPIMSGNEVCRILYNDEKLRAIPVVMMSAVNSMLAQAMPNCRRFLAKPFHFHQLITIVDDLLSNTSTY